MRQRSAHRRPPASARSSRHLVLGAVLLAMLTACGGVATQPAATLRSTPPADLALSQATAAAPTAEPLQSVVPSITPGASATLQPAPSPSTAPSTSPTPALADTPSPQPTPVLDPPPAAGPFSLRIPDEGAFVSQATAYWCVPAAMQTMINLIDDERLLAPVGYATQHVQ